MFLFSESVCHVTANLLHQVNAITVLNVQGTILLQNQQIQTSGGEQTIQTCGAETNNADV